MDYSNTMHQSFVTKYKTAMQQHHGHNTATVAVHLKHHAVPVYLYSWQHTQEYCSFFTERHQHCIAAQLS